MRHPWHLISRWHALGWPERGRLLAACVLLPLIWAGLRGPGLARVHGWMLSRPAPGAADPARALAVVGLVRMAGRRMPAVSTCLTRSLAALWLLNRAGVACRLRIGVRPTGAALDAHAWIECGGVPVGEPEGITQRYPAFGDPIHPERPALPPGVSGTDIP